MPILTLEAISENPWNAVRHELPKSPTMVLLALAHFMAESCWTFEDTLSVFIHRGGPMPLWLTMRTPTPAIHIGHKARAIEAKRRCAELKALCYNLYSIDIEEIEF